MKTFPPIILKKFYLAKLQHYSNDFGQDCSSVVENAFGIAASRFRILRREIIAKPEKVERITMAVVALHNFLIISEQKQPASCRMYLARGYMDSEDR